MENFVPIRTVRQSDISPVGRIYGYYSWELMMQAGMVGGYGVPTFSRTVYTQPALVGDNLFAGSRREPFCSRRDHFLVAERPGEPSLIPILTGAVRYGHVRPWNIGSDVVFEIGFSDIPWITSRNGNGFTQPVDSPLWALLFKYIDIAAGATAMSYANSGNGAGFTSLQEMPGVPVTKVATVCMLPPPPFRVVAFVVKSKAHQTHNGRTSIMTTQVVTAQGPDAQKQVVARARLKMVTINLKTLAPHAHRRGGNGG